MQQWICKYCGKDTKWIDMDYLVGTEHLQCVLEAINKSKKSKGMTIKNWDKISGYTYKGYTIINPIHNANGNMYYADVLNLNLPQKPKWHLELMIDGEGYKSHTLTLLDGNGLNIKHLIELVDIRTAALFRVRYEEIIDEMLATQLLSAPTYNSHSLSGTVNINNSSNGILNTINTNGNNIVVAGTINGTMTQYNLVDTIHELQRQIDELKLHTPTNPF
jgi:hypothetical protein